MGAYTNKSESPSRFHSFFLLCRVAKIPYRWFGNRHGGDIMTNSTEQPRWRRSTRCGSNACVEVARVGGDYLIRDSKDPDGGLLRFSPEEWAAFASAVQAGEFHFE